MSATDDHPTTRNGWHYVASRTVNGSTGEQQWQIREMHYAVGKFGWTVDAITPSGETLHELRSDLTHMLTDTYRGTLDLTNRHPYLEDPAESRPAQAGLATAFRTLHKAVRENPAEWAGLGPEQIFRRLADLVDTAALAGLTLDPGRDIVEPMLARVRHDTM